MPHVKDITSFWPEARHQSLMLNAWYQLPHKLNMAKMAHIKSTVLFALYKLNTMQKAICWM